MRFLRDYQLVPRPVVATVPDMDNSPHYSITYGDDTAWYQDLDPVAVDGGVEIRGDGGNYGKVYQAGRLY